MRTPRDAGSEASTSASGPPAPSGSEPNQATAPSRPLWKRWLVPRIESPRHAIPALVVGFLLEALTEVYQFATRGSPVSSSSLGYYVSLATTILGFYFLWRGLHEWNRAGPRPVAPGSRRSLREPLAILCGGVAAAAGWDILLGQVGHGDTPAPLAWVVGGVMVLAVGSFFLSLARRAAPFQGAPGRALGWAAFGWSLATSVVAGLVLGQGIVGLFVDFFTSWPKLIVSLAPFIGAIAPLFVAFFLVTAAYVDAYPRAPDRATATP
jgi:hypothetical protein